MMNRLKECSSVVDYVGEKCEESDGTELEKGLNRIE